MAATQKDTIYVDIDDEITSIVEKMNASKSKIVALVLPKRATVLQSIVNMKLLKRTADEANKRVVLITSETGLMPLAGAVGMYVAKNLQTKPEIPSAPETPELDEELLETEERAEPDDGEIDKEASIGDLADDGDDSDIFEGPAAPASASAKAKAAKPAKAAKAKKDKKSRVPNFDAFRKKVLIGGALVTVLLIGLYAAFFIAPKAKITIKTETSTTNSTIAFTASPTADTVDVTKGIVPAKEVETKKTDSQKVAATGQKDVGTKATGTISVKNCEDSSSHSLPAGTVFTANSKNYTSNNSATVPAGSFSGGGSVCNSSSVSIAVTAAENGDSYNQAATSYSSSKLQGNFTISGSAMAGGTSKIAKVVSQQDIDSAKAKIADDSQSAKNELQSNLEGQNYYAILDTFATKQETITSSPEVDQEASEVTVTAERVYTMVGVKRDDLRALIDNDVKDEMAEKSLQIQDDGINGAVFRSGTRQDDGSLTINMQVQVVLGPKIDSDQVKKDIAGKKRGDVENIVKQIDGVKDVEVNYSPFWVSITPKKTDRITLVYEEASN